MTLLLQDFVSAQADQRPEAAAVVTAESSLTYEALEAQSNQLARVLRESGCGRGDRVCLLAPKTAAALMAIVAIYKADCVYVPLDPSGPAARLAKIVHACEPRSVLITAGAVGLMDELVRLEPAAGTVPAGSLDQRVVEGDAFRSAFSLGDLSAVPATRVAYRNWPDDTAHILFTSGSTGSPKGVVLTHANVKAFVSWAMHYFGVLPSDRQSAHSPLPFDLSVYDIFGTFAAGATLYPVPNELNVFPNKLADFIREHELTQWFSVPSLLSYMAQLDVLEFHDFPALKRVMWCGEALPTRTLRYWMTRLGHVQFTNLYGPTETTIASSYFTVPECPGDNSYVTPIGEACAGEELLVLDERFQPQPPGDVGDLYIRGAGVSPGYWRNDAATSQAFVSDPYSGDPTDRLYRTGDLAHLGYDGLVYFDGRRDSQIKSRGHRIELGEIEAALHSLPSLHDSVVVALKSDGFEGTIVCCAYAPAAGTDVTPAVLRKQLAELLPPYMLPSHWKAFTRLPLTPNGKADRNKILESFSSLPTVTR